MHYNNRMPSLREKKIVYPKEKHKEKKDGVTIFVEGLQPYPYKDVSADSLTLKSRIDTGVFEDHEGSVRKLEKAQGSDIMTAEIERQEREYEEKKKQAAQERQRKKAQKIIDDFNAEKDKHLESSN